MGGIERDTETRLRELNGVLDLAVLLAVDVICEHDDHGLSKHEWQRRLISQAARKLTESGQFPGRLALFSDDEIREIRVALRSDTTLFPERDSALDGEFEFEVARRGIFHEQEAGDVGA